MSYSIHGVCPGTEFQENLLRLWLFCFWSSQRTAGQTWSKCVPYLSRPTSVQLTWILCLSKLARNEKQFIAKSLLALGYKVRWAELKVAQLTVIWNRLRANWKLLLLIRVSGAVGHESVFFVFGVTACMFLESSKHRYICRAPMRIKRLPEIIVLFQITAPELKWKLSTETIFLLAGAFKTPPTSEICWLAAEKCQWWGL